MGNQSEFNIGKTIRALFSVIAWGVGAMIIGGLFSGLLGATIALSIMSYWRLCMMTMASPLFFEFTKTIEKFEKKQTINQALIADLEEMREKFNDLRAEFEDFQVVTEKRLSTTKK
jgi:hypothetical protein